MTERAVDVRVSRFAREDLIAIAGLALLVSGVFLIYRPASLIVLGVFLLAYAFAYQVSHPKKESSAMAKGE